MTEYKGRWQARNKLTVDKPGMGEGVKFSIVPPDRSIETVVVEVDTAVDLAVEILAEHAPALLSFEKNKRPKLDDRFKVGDWVRRNFNSLFKELNGPLLVVDVRPYTRQERLVYSRVPEDAVRVTFLIGGEGGEHRIASNWLIASEPPKPSEPEFKVGDFVRRKNGYLIRDVMRVTSIEEPDPNFLWPKGCVKLNYELADGRNEFGNFIASHHVEKVDVEVVPAQSERWVVKD